jgi:hypothetical protein
MKVADDHVDADAPQKDVEVALRDRDSHLVRAQLIEVARAYEEDRAPHSSSCERLATEATDDMVAGAANPTTCSRCDDGDLPMPLLLLLPRRDAVPRGRLVWPPLEPCLAPPRGRDPRFGDERFFAERFFAAPRFGATFAPERRASESPIAIACLRVVTLRPERPERSWPRFISCIAAPTLRPAFFPYFLAPDFFAAMSDSPLSP